MPRLLAVSQQLKVDKRAVQAVASGMETSIARTKDKAALELMLCAEIEACAQVYCGATNISDLFAEEAFEFVCSQYSFLGVNEIKSAFRLAAAKELTDTKGNILDIKAYAGVFSLDTLGTVLNAYVAYRKRIEQELSRVQQEAAEAQKEAERKAKIQDPEWRKTYFEDLVAFLKRNPHLIVARHYDELSAEGFIQVTDEEKRVYLERAKDTLQAALAEEKENERNAFQKAYIAAMMRKTDSEDYKERLRGEARRLIVVDFIKAND